MKNILFASASILALSGTAAMAAPTTEVYGGGSTLASKIYRDLYNCYGSPLTLSNSANPQPNGENVISPAPAVTYPTASACGSSVDATTEFLFAPTGSGAALTGFTTAAALPVGVGGKVATSNPVTYASTTSANPYPVGDFIGSDSPLPNTAYTLPAGYSKSLEIPTAAVGIAVPFNVHVGAIQANAQLTSAQICGIYDGKYTNWSQLKKVLYDPSAVTGTDANGNPKPTVFLTSPNEAIHVVERSDGSGTTFITTNFIQYTCKPVTSDGTKDFIASDQPAVWNQLPLIAPNHLTGAGSGGVAATVLANEGAIGYISSDFVQPQSATGPEAAYIQNKAKLYVPVTSAGVTDSSSAVKITLKGYTGDFTTDPKLVKENIPAWNAVLAGKNEGALVSKANDAYPIFGFTFTDAYACQPHATQQAKVHDLLNWVYGAGYSTVQSVYAPGAFGAIDPTNAVTTSVGYQVKKLILPLLTSSSC